MCGTNKREYEWKKVFLYAKSQKIIDKNKNAFYEKKKHYSTYVGAVTDNASGYCVLLSNIINAYF